MTTNQIILVICFYLALLVAVAYFTRARVRRIMGAFVGGVVFALAGLAGFVLGESQGWWQMPKAAIPHFYLWFCVGTAVSCTPTYLIVWRVVRRFGGRGLAVCILVSTIIGPPRDYWITKMFPAWMTFAPGIAPVLADAAIYFLLVVVGYAVMRMAAGTAQGDLLATRRGAGR